jgi:hypothetical protein
MINLAGVVSRVMVEATSDSPHHQRLDQAISSLMPNRLYQAR